MVSLHSLTVTRTQIHDLTCATQQNTKPNKGLLHSRVNFLPISLILRVIFIPVPELASSLTISFYNNEINRRWGVKKSKSFLDWVAFRSICYSWRCPYYVLHATSTSILWGSPPNNSGPFLAVSASWVIPSSPPATLTGCPRSLAWARFRPVVRSFLGSFGGSERVTAWDAAFLPYANVGADSVSLGLKALTNGHFLYRNCRKLLIQIYLTALLVSFEL